MRRVLGAAAEKSGHSFQTNRNSPYKKKMNGEVIRREH